MIPSLTQNLNNLIPEFTFLAELKEGENLQATTSGRSFTRYFTGQQDFRIQKTVDLGIGLYAYISDAYHIDNFNVVIDHYSEDMKKTEGIFNQLIEVLEKIHEIECPYEEKSALILSAKKVFCIVGESKEGLQNWKKTLHAKLSKEDALQRERKIDELLALADKVLNQFSMSSSSRLERVASYIPISSNENTFFSTYGKGPTILGRIFSGIKTVEEIVRGTLYPISFENASDFYRTRRGLIANQGLQLRGEDVHQFIDRLPMPLNTIHSFYLTSGSGINNKSFEQIKKEIESQAKYFSSNQPIVIPLTFEGESMWERSHIAVILIEGSTIEYYDAKGVLSIYRPLGDKKFSLFDVLLFCKEQFSKSAIIENPYTHQNDAHNCGVYICFHVYHRLVSKQLAPKFTQESPSLAEINNFRHTMITIAYPIPKEETSKEKNNLI